jgi:hypothetical protein
MSEVYLGQLTFCKGKSLLCHAAYHDVATIGLDEPGEEFVEQLGGAPTLVGLGVGVALGLPFARFAEATNLHIRDAHTSWAVMRRKRGKKNIVTSAKATGLCLQQHAARACF